jgi:virginiamycin A acetyltransferase
MIGIFKSLWIATYLYLMRRRQHDNVQLRHFFQNKYDIVVGMYSYGCFDRWRMPGPMIVGRYCSIASTVRSALTNHPLEGLTTHPALYDPAFGVVETYMDRPEPLIIEDDVWIGHNVVLTPGCKLIGRGAVIGAGAVVTRNVEPYSVMGGNPARKLRARFDPDLAAAIEQTRWWEMDMSALQQLVQQQRELVFHPSLASVQGWLDGMRA